MHNRNLHLWAHSHGFGQDKQRPGEIRTLWVIGITGTMMLVEIAAGIAFASMALLADGLHMASHASALGVNALAYIYARRHAHDARYSFGTGKVNALGGFTGAVLLAVFALMMTWESIGRLMFPVAIAVDQAVVVATLGLMVNGVCAGILGFGGVRHHAHHGGGTHAHRPEDFDHHDHNLASARLHVLADALTSLLAIFALLTAKYLGLVWMDPAMGIVGAVLVSRWSLGLIRATASVLLDKQGPQEMQEMIRKSVEVHDQNRVVDLHLWSIGPNIHAVEISLVTPEPKPPADYKALIPESVGCVHMTVEVHRCPHAGEAEQGASMSGADACGDSIPPHNALDASAAPLRSAPETRRGAGAAVFR